MVLTFWAVFFAILILNFMKYIGYIKLVKKTKSADRWGWITLKGLELIETNSISMFSNLFKCTTNSNGIIRVYYSTSTKNIVTLDEIEYVDENYNYHSLAPKTFGELLKIEKHIKILIEQGITNKKVIDLFDK